MEWRDFVTTGRMGDDTIGATNLVGELGDRDLVCIASDLNADEYEVVRSKA